MFSTKLHDEDLRNSITQDTGIFKDLLLQIKLLTEDRDQWKHSARIHTSNIDKAYKKGYKRGYDDCDKRKASK